MQRSFQNRIPFTFWSRKVKGLQSLFFTKYCLCNNKIESVLSPIILGLVVADAGGGSGVYADLFMVMCGHVSSC